MRRREAARVKRPTVTRMPNTTITEPRRLVPNDSALSANGSSGPNIAPKYPEEIMASPSVTRATSGAYGFRRANIGSTTRSTLFDTEMLRIVNIAQMVMNPQKKKSPVCAEIISKTCNEGIVRSRAITPLGSTYTSCARANAGRNRSTMPANALYMFDHILFNIFNGTTYFLAGIQNVERIKYLFHFGEKLAHFFSIHDRQIGSADDAVVVLSSDGAFILGDEFVDLRAELKDLAVIQRSPQIHQGNDMEIRVTDVSGNRIEKFVVREKCLEFRQEPWIVARMHDDVVDEGRGIQAFQIFAQQRETFPPDGPVFCRCSFAFGNLGAHREAFQRISRFLGLLECSVRGVFGEFGHKH